MKFTHLKYIKQTYLEHFIDAISYSFMSFQASFFFFVHAFWPDIFEFNGSKQILQLNNILVEKMNKLYNITPFLI
jgi:hypothetical protein